VAWVLVVPALLQAGPGRPSHADVPSRAIFVSSQGFAPLEGSPCLARERVIKCLTVEAAALQRRRAFLDVAAARTRSGRSQHIYLDYNFFQQRKARPWHRPGHRGEGDEDEDERSHGEVAWARAERLGAGGDDRTSEVSK
jgi:hypothetical protein